MDLSTALFFLPGLLVGITVHEFAHAWSASLLGDDFPRRQGRVSLNPLRHLAPLGTLAILLLPFGWGKPVYVNLYNFRRPRRDYLITSLAGPAANLAVAAALVGLLQLTRHSYALGHRAEAVLTSGHYLLTFVAIINTVLATVNLIPIPPLDGSKIWPLLIPALKPTFGKKAIRVFILILVVLVWTRSLTPVVGFALDGLFRLVPLPDTAVFDERLAAGIDAYQAERFASAEALLSEALAANPRSSESLLWRGMARYEQDDLPGALNDFDRAIELGAADPDCYDWRAAIMEAQDRPADAERDRRTAAALRAATGVPGAPADTQPAAPLGR